MIGHTASLYHKISNFIKSEEGPILQLPMDCLFNKILFSLDLQSVGRCLQVTKRWKRLLQNDQLLKKLIYDQIFNPSDWRTRFGDKLAPLSSDAEALAALPYSVIDFFKSKGINKNWLKEDYQLVWIPKGISISQIDRLCMERIQVKEVRNIYVSTYLKVHFHLGGLKLTNDLKTTKSEWVAIRKERPWIINSCVNYKNSGFSYCQLLIVAVGLSIANLQESQPKITFEPLFDSYSGIRVL